MLQIYFIHFINNRTYRNIPLLSMSGNSKSFASIKVPTQRDKYSTSQISGKVCSYAPIAI